MGGRGSSSVSVKGRGVSAKKVGSFLVDPGSLTDEQIEQRMKEIDAIMQENAYDAVNYVLKVPGTRKEARAIYDRARDQYHILKEEKNKRDLARIEARHKKEEQSKPPKTFVNGFGEATHRYIATTTYERAQKRIDKQIFSFLGR